VIIVEQQHEMMESRSESSQDETGRATLYPAPVEPKADQVGRDPRRAGDLDAYRHRLTGMGT
jgi:hypothetical protein